MDIQKSWDSCRCQCINFEFTEIEGSTPSLPMRNYWVDFRLKELNFSSTDEHVLINWSFDESYMHAISIHSPNPKLVCNLPSDEIRSCGSPSLITAWSFVRVHEEHDIEDTMDTLYNSALFISAYDVKVERFSERLSSVAGWCISKNGYYLAIVMVVEDADQREWPPDLLLYDLRPFVRNLNWYRRKAFIHFLRSIRPKEDKATSTNHREICSQLSSVPRINFELQQSCIFTAAVSLHKSAEDADPSHSQQRSRETENEIEALIWQVLGLPEIQRSIASFL